MRSPVVQSEPIPAASRVRPIPVRRVGPGHYVTSDGRFAMRDLGFGTYRWVPETDWDDDPTACAVLGSGQLAWTTLRALRLAIAQVYADEPTPRGRWVSPLAEALGL